MNVRKLTDKQTKTMKLLNNIKYKIFVPKEEHDCTGVIQLVHLHDIHSILFFYLFIIFHLFVIIFIHHNDCNFV